MRTFAQKPKALQQTTPAKSTIPSRAHFGQSGEVQSILHLQHTIGNLAVQRMLGENTEGKKDDSTTAIGRFGHDFSRTVHAATPATAQLGVTTGTADVREVIGSGGGRALPSDVRSGMESRLGDDFAGVQIHDDARAAESAAALSAQAYAVGEHIIGVATTR